MELGNVLLVIIKIVISTSLMTNGAVLMGGHIENKNHTDLSDVMYSDDYEYADAVEDAGKQAKNKSEEVPNPSPLVLPGYNLPETIFNHGKPFYVEKDPLTGKIDFDHKSPSLKSEEYEYVDENPSDDIYDKKNINRKDGSLSSHSSHKQADINQLTPNFHDFLNLPVKYNPEKYVYPLISSSYASTKIQGSVNKFHNHKDSFGVQKTTTTKKPQTQSYYTTTYAPRTTQRTMATTPVTTTTTTRLSTVKRYPELTTAPANIMNAGMSHPSFGEEYDYYDETTVKPTTKLVTTPNVKDVYLTTKSTSTKAPMSLFEQLFGDYDDTVTTTKPTKPIIHLTTTTPTTTSLRSTTSTTTTQTNIDNNYEYTDEDYSEVKLQDNIAVENKPQPTKEDHLTVEPLKTITKLTPLNKTVFETKPKLDKKPSFKPFTYKPTDKPKFSSTMVSVTSTTNEPTRVTSLPLGDNHIGAPINRDPIIVATQNLREKLNSEKVPEAPLVEMVQRPAQPFNQLAPSSSNIHIAPGQDTVSFVVGHHQSVGDGGQYVGSAVEDNTYQGKPSRPLFDNREPSVNFKPPKPEVTIQPLQNSEAALAIGLPVGVKQVPGQVMDASLPDGLITFPQNDGKVVFPDDKAPKPVRNEPNPASNKDVLQLNSKPMYHQLPSDLTPPKESEVAIYDKPARPPWDPRPGHFHSGKPEYVRPPRPHPDVAYKRIDYLPNILPQFRPNMKPHYSMGPPPYPYDQRLNRQPLLERPSNRPIGFFEKMGPPPPPPGVYKRYPLKNVVRIEERRPSHYHLDDRRPLAQQPPQSLDDNQTPMAEDRIMNDPPRRPEVVSPPELNLYQTPPNIQIANRRESESGVETLQMIQAKNEKKEEEVAEGITGDTVKVPAKDVDKSEADKTIYKVYPVNTPEDVVETKPKTPERDFNYYEYQDRNDDPILKPHPRPVTVPVKSDFPYPLERPDGPNHKADVQHDIISNNQWNAVGDNIESRIVTGSKGYGNQISATLKTYTDKPIAIAYTPTEPNMDKYSMPNYGSLVIPEIRPGTVENADTGYGSKNEFTVHASINTNPKPPSNHKFNHKVDLDMDSPVPQQDFQAPFQASVKLDASTNQGWSVLREKSKSSTVDDSEATTLPLATTSEFDIENFKPQLEGGFKPLYSMPDEEGRKAEDIPDEE